MIYPVPMSQNADRGLVGFIDEDGRIVVQPTYLRASVSSEGKVAVVDAYGKTGFVDNAGNLALPCKFEGLSDYREGLCSVSCGYIDHSGEWFIEPQFLVADNFSEGKAVASIDGETFGFVGMTGEFVIPPEFQKCASFSEGLAPVCRDDRWGFVDHRANVRIPFVFEKSRARARLFQNGLAAVRLDGLYGFINHSGRFVVSPKYEDAKSFSEGFAPVRQKEGWGMIDLEGKTVIPCQFEEFGELSGGMAFAKSDGKAGFICAAGSWVIQPTFERCYPFWGSLAVARRDDGGYCYIRRNGEVVWNSDAGVQFQLPYVLRSA